jgi:hypothetical protein
MEQFAEIERLATVMNRFLSKVFCEYTLLVGIYMY